MADEVEASSRMRDNDYLVMAKGRASTIPACCLQENSKATTLCLLPARFWSAYIKKPEARGRW